MSIMSKSNFHTTENPFKPLDKSAILGYNVKVGEEILYDVDDIHNIFKGIGINQAYELMREKGFSSFKVGRIWFVEKSLFEKWLG